MSGAFAPSPVLGRPGTVVVVEVTPVVEPVSTSVESKQNCPVVVLYPVRELHPGKYGTPFTVEDMLDMLHDMPVTVLNPFMEEQPGA